APRRSPVRCRGHRRSRARLARSWRLATHQEKRGRRRIGVGHVPLAVAARAPAVIRTRADAARDHEGEKTEHDDRSDVHGAILAFVRVELATHARVYEDDARRCRREARTGDEGLYAAWLWRAGRAGGGDRAAGAAARRSDVDGWHPSRRLSVRS